MLVAQLEKEWERVEALTDIAVQARRSKSAAPEDLQALRKLQSSVSELRHSGVWERLVPGNLSSLDYDILACVIAPDISPRVAHIYKLLHGQQFMPYPTLHILQELLGLTPIDMPALYKAVNENSPLQETGMINFRDDGPNAIIKPGLTIRNRLMGVKSQLTPPPGTIQIFSTKHWSDLILPNEIIRQIKDYLALITHRSYLTKTWGLPNYSGPIAMFCGGSGTGKTLAASVIATELDWPLFRVDTAALISKYIGETEKNLDVLFSAAHNQKMVLQFDEADALFAKRGTIRNASDRYANQQGSHLLTRIESHNGPCILTTNLRQQIDPAFLRRFHCVADFPPANQSARRKLWEKHISPDVPLSADVDFDLLAAHAHLNGGSIRNASLHACGMAAREATDANAKVNSSVKLRMIDLVRAVWLEVQKEGRAVSLSEIGPLATFLRSEGE